MRTITRVEAMLVDLLAGGVAAGVAESRRRDTLLWEQFVTPELFAPARDNPDLLTGRDADVTMLSCDIRASAGSAPISGQSDAGRNSECPGVLSTCVFAEEGVLVDYVATKLLGMWGLRPSSRTTLCEPAGRPRHAGRRARN